MPVKIEKKVDNLHVTSIEEVIYLLQESEERGGETDAREAYVKGLEYFANLK
ncbi:MAG: hypothetical protein PHS49_02400 [Candidatus Gracilibacteria bacterium]|nr:hypothetical protein [Candidatus Gracilibacteria bacterium]